MSRARRRLRASKPPRHRCRSRSSMTLRRTQELRKEHPGPGSILHFYRLSSTIQTTSSSSESRVQQTVCSTSKAFCSSSFTDIQCNEEMYLTYMIGRRISSDYRPLWM